MGKGYFYTNDYDNETEVKIIESFFNETNSKYYANNKTLKNSEFDTCNVLNYNGELILLVGLFSILILFVLLYDDSNKFIVIFSFLALIGYFSTWLQLKKMGKYIETYYGVKEEVENYNENEEKLKRALKNN